METNYGVATVTGNGPPSLKERFVFPTYKQASEAARHFAHPNYQVYVVRIVPVAVFTANVAMEPVSQPEAEVLAFP